MSDAPAPLTLIYSRVDRLELKLDLYLPPNATGALPAIVSFHGGGLTVGVRHLGPMSPVWLFGS
jgi:acetyl esterase/lipase